MPAPSALAPVTTTARPREIEQPGDLGNRVQHECLLRRGSRRALRAAGPATVQQRIEAHGIAVADPEGVFRPVGDAPPVGDRHAERERRGGLHGHVDPPARKQVGPQHIGGHAGAVQRRALPAVFAQVEGLREFEHLRRRDAATIAERAHRPQPRGRRKHAMGHVERQQGQRQSGAKHHVGGLRIDIDVELGRGGDVAALETGARHRDHLGDSGAISAPRSAPSPDWSAATASRS